MKTRLLKITPADFAAFGTWLTVFLISVHFLQKLSADSQALWPFMVVLFIAYIGCYWALACEPALAQSSSKIQSRENSTSPSFSQYRATLLLVQLGCVFGLISIFPFDYLSILTIIWAGTVAYFISIRATLVLVLVVVVAYFTFFAWRWDRDTIIVQAMLFLTFHVFAVLMSHQTHEAEKAKTALEKVNQELLTTQEILRETSQQAERTRIARDLHDLLGHHLTALIINLQVISHQSSGEVKEKILQCHDLAKLLMSDVREAVSVLRENQSFDLQKMLQVIVDNTPRLTVHSQVDATIRLDDVALVKSILSIIQEALTNSLKHAKASEFWIELSQTEGQIRLTLRDNGRPTAPIIQGNGLIGMQERVAEYQGKVAFKAEPKQGFLIEVVVPV